MNNKYKRCTDCEHLKKDDKGPWVSSYDSRLTGHTTYCSCPYMTQRFKALLDKDLLPKECLIDS